jgi:hypothetical protein
MEPAKRRREEDEAIIMPPFDFRSLHEFFSIRLSTISKDGEEGAMPSRLISLAILVYWSIAAFCLLTWDVLPELTMGYPPDLRAITFASDSKVPVRWSIQVVDDPRSPDARRAVGEAITASSRQANGWYEMTSQVAFDAADLLRGTPFATRGSIRLQIDSRYHVDPSGNLHDFDLHVKSGEFGDEMIVVKGQLKGKTMEIATRGPIEILNKELKFDYEPRSVVQDVLGPLDRLPGLQVGQRWEARVINPFNGKVDLVKAQVVRRAMIDWDGNSVWTFEVEQKMSPLSMKTWVRTDGAILRQEVPFPFVRLMLERRPADSRSTSTPPSSSPSSSLPARGPIP